MSATVILQRPPSDLIGGEWIGLPDDGSHGAGIVSVNPAHPDEVVWAATPVPEHVDRAVAAAREAFGPWSRTSIEQRERVLRAYQERLKDKAGQIAELIRDEAGKAMWECRGEAAALAAKIDITLDEQTEQNWGRARVAPFDLKLNDTKSARGHFRPHGVMAVVGPFNFPAHLPNGHIVPALLMGNTIVFKPSDKTPAVGQLLTRLLHEALESENAPPGVVNLVQGDAVNASALVSHADIDGILFTGSWPVGRRILEANLDRPGRIVALELGGNSPAVVMPDADLKQAAIEIARCAFNTTGQRCTSTRRLIVHEAVADKLIAAVCKAGANMVVGDPRSDLPVFMGPLVTSDARQAALSFQARAARTGGEVLMEMTAPASLGEGHYITPGVIKVPAFTADPDRGDAGFDCGCDEEIFGPLLRVSVVDSFDAALEQANATRYGLASSVFTRDQSLIDRFLAESRSGCVNVNCGTAGASSKLAFGGLGLSGNHRPAGSYALDYCAYPVASMIESGDAATLPEGMTFEDGWLS
ncbi:MAG: aldehyde dehydrogenase family protein [Planctomycetota bacterium]